MSKVFFANSGSEANDTAIKLVWYYQNARGLPEKKKIIARQRGYHGITLAAGHLTASLAYTASGFDLPMMNRFRHVTAPSLYRYGQPGESEARFVDRLADELERLILAEGPETVAAFVAEPVQGAGGVIVPPPGYFARLLELCDEREMLTIFDECQTGLGRLGTMYGFERYGVVPDFLVLSKTLGGGVPIGAVVTSAAIESACHELGFIHVTSHVSDPLPAAVGRAVLRTVLADDLMSRAVAMGERLRAGLEELMERHEAIGEVRGVGLMLGVDVVTDRDSREPDGRMGSAVTERCLELGLNVNVIKFAGLGSVLRIAPPLTITAEEIDLGVEIIDSALTDCR
jgi:2,2-dialkylglycine decarboxylase (pyruvate)